MQDALSAYSLVFDAVYTPRVTRLLKEAEEAGATVVSGLEMFIRQAMQQFSLFTEHPRKFYVLSQFLKVPYVQYLKLVVMLNTDQILFYTKCGQLLSG